MAQRPAARDWAARPNTDSYGSALVERGEAQDYDITERQTRAMFRKHRVTDEDEDDWRFWEASWELMHLAEAHWTTRRHSA